MTDMANIESHLTPIRDAILGLARKGEFPCRLIEREAGVPYLYRHYLRKADSSEFGAFLHRFVASDQVEELHCHPWSWSFSIILEGHYEEERAGRLIRLDDEEDFGDPVRYGLYDIKKKIFKPFDVNMINHDDYHRVELLSPEVWTLFVHGPRKGDWRFVHRETGAVREITGRTFDVGKVVK